jgi:diamine N-acetyltransferase
MNLDNHKITFREVTSSDGIISSTGIIRDSFGTVAIQFGLTQQNCPTHPSFITVDQLIGLRKRGLTFFGLFAGEKQVGFVAIEKAGGGLYYLEKLAVVPYCRHNGFGRRLVKQALEYIRTNGGQKVSIGIINEHAVLKNWYRESGFKETGTKKFAHLPFTVCFLEFDLYA